MRTVSFLNFGTQDFLITSGLNFSVAVYNWFLPDDHAIYINMKRSVNIQASQPLFLNLRVMRFVQASTKLNSHTQNVKIQLLPAAQAVSLDILFP